jgi:hypothetical protein
MDNRCQQARKASFHGQFTLVFSSQDTRTHKVRHRSIHRKQWSQETPAHSHTEIGGTLIHRSS